MTHQIKRNGYRVLLDEPTVYVDNRARGRSGHMSHLMLELRDGRVMDFNSNCSAVRLGGHAAFGWVEYRYSEDGGESFGDIHTLPYSWDTLLDGVNTISVEKGAVCDDGRIVLLCLRNTQKAEVCCEPWLTPTVVTSDDGGATWSAPAECSPYRGRIYDALCRDGVMYFLQSCNDAEVHFCGSRPEHLYRLYTSRDGGETFAEASVLPWDGQGLGYGALVFDGAGRLHAYAYNLHEETAVAHAVSGDNGATWQMTEPCFVAKGIRNPQIGCCGGVYILHGRAGGGKGFVVYTSQDAVHWDEGTYLETEKTACYYSNNILLRDASGEERLLVQYSDSYRTQGDAGEWVAPVNVMHMWVRVQRDEA